MQRNGRVNSGDVSIFYRAFGARGATPILLMHGANREYPRIEWATANSQHDVADQAPQELVAAVRKFAAGA
jgi:hypothetical protein